MTTTREQSSYSSSLRRGKQLAYLSISENMSSNVLETSNSSSEDAKDISKKSTKLNMKPCQSCKEARKKVCTTIGPVGIRIDENIPLAQCELFEGAYPCKRCLDRFFKGVTSTIVCGPSQRRSRSRKNDLGNGLLVSSCFHVKYSDSRLFTIPPDYDGGFSAFHCTMDLLQRYSGESRQ